MFPDRVTLQPAFRPRRTPFGFYKNFATPRVSEVNSSKFAAKRLGISDKEFEDSLTCEINDLLSEIEATRRNELHLMMTLIMRVINLIFLNLVTFLLVGQK